MLNLKGPFVENPDSNKNISVVHIDDDSLVLSIFSRKFRKTLIPYLGTTSPELYFQKIHEMNESGRSLVCISDLDMPELQGSEVLKRVYEMAPHASLIIFSGNPEERGRVWNQLNDAGANIQAFCKSKMNMLIGYLVDLENCTTQNQE